jgi:ATP-dependent Zn protease
MAVSYITILPRGQYLGVTQFTAQEDRYNFSRETLMACIAVGLGGRVAEELTFGPDGVTTGGRERSKGCHGPRLAHGYTLGHGEASRYRLC